MFSLVVSEKSAIGLEMNSESQALWEREERRDLYERFAPLAPFSTSFYIFLRKPPTISLIKKDNFYSSTIS